eukprot:10194137-Ditylum_brightwellii.AAC.1
MIRPCNFSKRGIDVQNYVRFLEIWLTTTFLASRSLTVRQQGSGPGFQAVPAATEGLAWQPKLQRRSCQRGSPPKTGVAQKGVKRECHT